MKAANLDADDEIDVGALYRRLTPASLALLVQVHATSLHMARLARQAEGS